ncbi:DUF350 domain-containing protein [Deinococcus yavapaiensis]|uniref:Uncharacterized protein DUF350 n=1 Tax=Deinococcus yavapaiensis KR-236 TaxID=694435 RepID=A0A318S8W0_9DEIO|nr:DUF350 domain-containing protein [Deinococcus yavapaiensis]PYE54397.1 uncharacterized protein DUF350 [Deinococcus yavapaiensis KR-236]
MDISREVGILLLSVLYAFVGTLLLLVGYRLFDRFTPTDAQKKIFEEGNVAVAVLFGGFLVGLAIVIAAALSG